MKIPVQVPAVSGVSVYICTGGRPSAPVSSRCSSPLCRHRCDDGAREGLLPAHTNKKNPQILYALLAFSETSIQVQSYLGVQKEVTMCRFSISSGSPDLLNVTFKALHKYLPVKEH